MIDVVAALLRRDNRFLICQRPSHKARPLQWEFVGGKVEPGETLQQALIRECREELDITVAVQDVFTQVIHEYPDISIRLTLLSCTLPEGEPKLLEHVAMAWITPDQIPDFDFCPADRQMLDSILHRL